MRLKGGLQAQIAKTKHWKAPNRAFICDGSMPSAEVAHCRIGLSTELQYLAAKDFGVFRFGNMPQIGFAAE